MRILSLKLQNFQKHSDLSLDFTDGVNYIYGHSDAGKSCIRRAIGFLFFGDPRNEDIRKEGTKQTSVSAVLDNGIEVERIKSATINRYVIKKEGKEIVYDSIGASIPEEVQSVLQANVIEIDKETLNLNVAEQISLPFLLDKPGSFRLKLFNKLTGSDLIDKLIQNLNKEILGIGRDIKSEGDFITVNEPKLNEVTIQHTEKQTLLGNFQKAYSSLKIKIERYKILKDLQSKLETINSDITKAKTDLELIKIISDETINNAHKLYDKWVILTDLKEAVEDNQTEITQIKAQIDSIKTPDFNFNALKEQITLLDTLKKAQIKLQDLNRDVISTKGDIGAYEVKIIESEAEYETLLKEVGVCPTCKQDTKNCQVHL